MFLALPALVLAASFTSDLFSRPLGLLPRPNRSSTASIPDIPSRTFHHSSDAIVEMVTLMSAPEWDRQAARCLWRQSMNINFDDVQNGLVVKFLHESNKHGDCSLFEDLVKFGTNALSVFHAYVTTYGFPRHSNLPADLREAFEVLIPADFVASIFPAWSEISMASFYESKDGGFDAERLKLVYQSHGLRDITPWEIIEVANFRQARAYCLSKLYFHPRESISVLDGIKEIRDIETALLISEVYDRNGRDRCDSIRCSGIELSPLDVPKIEERGFHMFFGRVFRNPTFKSASSDNSQVCFCQFTFTIRLFIHKNPDRVLETRHRIPVAALSLIMWEYSQEVDLVPLPEKMPPVQQLIPFTPKKSPRYAPVYQRIIRAYTINALTKEMRKDSRYAEEIYFYMMMFGGEAYRRNAMLMEMDWPTVFTEEEKTAWRFYYFTNNIAQPFSDHASTEFSFLGYQIPKDCKMDTSD